MERTVLDFATVFIGDSEHLLGLVLRRGGKGKVACGRNKPASLHHGVYLVFVIRAIFRGKTGKRQVHIRRIAPALTGMSLVNDNGEFIIFMFLPDLGHYVRKLFDRGDYDAFAVLYGFAKVTGMLRPSNGVLDLHELLDRVANLLV